MKNDTAVETEVVARPAGTLVSQSKAIIINTVDNRVLDAEEEDKVPENRDVVVQYVDDYSLGKVSHGVEQVSRDMYFKTYFANGKESKSEDLGLPDCHGVCECLTEWVNDIEHSRLFTPREFETKNLRIKLTDAGGNVILALYGSLEKYSHIIGRGVQTGPSFTGETDTEGADDTAVQNLVRRFVRELIIANSAGYAF